MGVIGLLRDYDRSAPEGGLTGGWIENRDLAFILTGLEIGGAEVEVQGSHPQPRGRVWRNGDRLRLQGFRSVGIQGYECHQGLRGRRRRRWRVAGCGS